MNPGARPPRMTITNVVTGEFCEPQYNPAEFQEKLGATYAKLAIPGLSQQVKHFTNTDDITYSMTFDFDCKGMGPGGLKALLDARTFFRALVHPTRASAIDRGGPPRALFIWPNFMSLTCVLTSCTLNYTEFSIQATPSRMSAQVTLEEIRDKFVSMEDILVNG
jgi:hypothetical protein